MSAFDELYQEIIMDHYRSPRGRAHLETGGGNYVPDSTDGQVTVGGNGYLVAAWRVRRRWSY